MRADLVFGLVHGAWHRAACWEPLRAELDRRGVASVAVDLPADQADAGVADPAWSRAAERSAGGVLSALGGIEEERARRSRARALAAEAAATGDWTGWFERLYAEAEAGGAVVPWADGEANPHLTAWAARERRGGPGRRALVVGCGLGYDAEFLARLGYTVTAFDVAPTAIERAVRENPGSPVEYVAADLLDLPAAWTGRFDLVVEIYTVQPLYGPARERALAALAAPVAPGGTLLVIARATNEEDPERDPAMMPWALTRRELDQAGGPLRPVNVEQFMDDEDPPKLRWRAEFRRG